MIVPVQFIVLKVVKGQEGAEDNKACSYNKLRKKMTRPDPRWDSET
jgi:hypothetical protein